MSAFEIGNVVGDGNHRHLKVDLSRLLVTRALVQAGSGGGKSYALRKIIEESHGKVQQIILDIEGDFLTLREKFDFIVAGRGGDIPVSVKTAEVLARKVLELHADIIIDLSELKQHDKIIFVKNFCDALIASPKELWHPAMVVIDEAHLFAPEKAKSESLPAVVDLVTRGRKRGFCVILATQRIAKLHKDAAAECQNKLMGLATLDIDMKRVADELGFRTQDKMLTLRNLEPGEFYALGPAISNEVLKVKIGKVKTTHPEAGKVGAVPTPLPTGKIKSILAKLTDLPKVAETELKDKAALVAKLRELERELKEKPTLKKSDLKAIQKTAVQQAKRYLAERQKSAFLHFRKEVANSVNEVMEAMRKFRDGVSSSIRAVEEAIDIPADEVPFTNAAPPRLVPNPPQSLLTRSEPRMAERPAVSIEGRRFGKTEKAILGLLAMREGTILSKTQVAVWTHYSKKSSGFQNAISNLVAAGLVNRAHGEGLTLNPGGRDRAIEILGPDYQAPQAPTPEAWKEKLGLCERKVFERLLERPSDEWEKDDLAQATGYSAQSSGFQNAISKLASLGLAQRVGRQVRLNQEIIGG